MQNYKGALDSHILFLYTVAKTHPTAKTAGSSAKASEMNVKTEVDDARDEIEDLSFVYGGLDWDTGTEDRESLGKHRLSINKSRIVKSLKKPWRKMRGKSDKEPLMSNVKNVSTTKVTDWATISGSSSAQLSSSDSDTQLV